MSYKPTLRLLSGFLSFFFLTQDLSFAVTEIRSQNLSSVPGHSLALDFPRSVALVQDIHKAGSSKTLILFQDAHTNESAQDNLAKSLDLTLSKISRPIHVFMEGGTGDDSLSYLRAQAAFEKRQTVAASFLKRGLLNGAEYLDLTSERTFTLWGVEDEDLYWKAVRSYEEVVKSRGELKDYLSLIDQSIKSLKTRLLNPSLLSFDGKREAYLKDELPMTDYFGALLSEAKMRGIALEYYPHFVGIQKIKDLEAQIDFAKASEEQGRIVSAFSAGELETLVQDHEMSGRSPFKLSGKKHEGQDAFYAKLSEKTSGFQGFPELAKYAEYLKSIRDADPKALLKEQKLLEEQLYEALAGTRDERKLVWASRTLGYLKALADMSITPEEFEDYKLRSSRSDLSYLTGFLNKKIMDLGDSYERALFVNDRAQALITKAEEFYLLTYERDKNFIRNGLRKMDETGEDISILVAGGFHTANLKALLREKNISYIVVTPQVYYETNHARYEKILLSQLDFSPVDLSVPTKKLNGISYSTGGDGIPPRPIKHTPNLKALHEGLGVEVQDVSGARLSGGPTGSAEGLKLRDSSLEEKIIFINAELNKQSPSPLTYFAVQWLGLTDPASLEAKKAARALAEIMVSEKAREGIRDVAETALVKLDPNGVLLREVRDEKIQATTAVPASGLNEIVRGNANVVFRKISELTRDGEPYEGIRVNGLYIGRSNLSEYAQKFDLGGPEGVAFALAKYLRDESATTAGKDPEFLQNLKDLFSLDSTSPFGLKEGAYVLSAGRVEEDGAQRYALVIEPAVQPISGARLATGTSVMDGLPQAFTDNFMRYGFQLSDISVVESVDGKPQALKPGENPLKDSVRAQLIVGTTALQALAGASYAGLAKKLGMTEDAFGKIADGAAVTVGQNAMEYLAKAYDVTIIIAGNEGKTRDGSAALPEGMAINPGGRNGLFLYIGDSIEVTNGVKSGAQGSSSMMALFPANVPFEIDGYRVSLWSDFPGTPGIDPIITQRNSLKDVLEKLAGSKGVSVDSLSRSYEFLTLDRGKNDALIKEAEALGFTIHRKGDGDPIPGILRGIYGIPGQNGKKLIVISTGGGNEHRMAQIVATLHERSKIATTYASTVSLKKVDKDVENGNRVSGDMETAREWQPKDLEEFIHTNDEIQNANTQYGLNIPLLPTKAEDLNTFIQDETSLAVHLRGQASMGITSITGATSTDAGIFRETMGPITYTLLSHGKGVADVRGFFVNEEGRLFFFSMLLHAQNLTESRDKILSENKYGLTDELKAKIQGGTSSITTEEGERKLIVRPNWGIAVPNIDEELKFIVRSELQARNIEGDREKLLQKYLEKLAYWLGHEGLDVPSIRLEIQWILDDLELLSYRKTRATLAELTRLVRDGKISPSLSKDITLISAVVALAQLGDDSNFETAKNFGAFRSNLKTLGNMIDGAQSIRKFATLKEDGKDVLQFDLEFAGGIRAQKKMVPVTGARLAQLEKILSLKPDLQNYPPMRSEAVGNYTPEIANVLSLYYEVKDAKESNSPKTRRAKDLKSSDPKVLDEAVHILDEKVDRLDLERLLNYVRTMKDVRVKKGEIRGFAKSGRVDVEVIVSNTAAPTITEKVGSYQSTYGFKRFPLEEAQLHELLARIARSPKASRTAASKGARLASYYTLYMQIPSLAGEAGGFFWKEGIFDFSKGGRGDYDRFLEDNKEVSGFAGGFRQAHFTRFFEMPKLLFRDTKNKRDPGQPLAIVFRSTGSRKLKVIQLTSEKIDYTPYVEILKRTDPAVALDFENDFHPVPAEINVDISLEKFELKQPAGARLSPVRAGYTATAAMFASLLGQGAVKSEEPVQVPAVPAVSQVDSRSIAEKDGFIFNLNFFAGTAQLTDAASGELLKTIQLPLFFRDYYVSDLQADLTVTPNRKKAFVVMGYAINTAHVAELSAYLVLDLERGTAKVVDEVRRKPFLHESLDILRNGSARVQVRSYDPPTDMLTEKIYKRSISLRTPRKPDGARLAAFQRLDGGEMYHNYSILEPIELGTFLTQVREQENRKPYSVKVTADGEKRGRIVSHSLTKLPAGALVTVSFSGARLAAEQGVAIEIKKDEEAPIELKTPYVITTPLQELEVRQST
ncbi:MAG TPA: hypothetical protein VD883_04620, partial [Candidatus Omnitrophota bacterium]|nr:hypothetical protein [Candidatus Omnitrophota bacterium]